MLSNETIVTVRYAHKLSSYTNPDMWFKEKMPYKRINGLLDEGYLVEVKWNEQDTNNEDNT